MMRFTAPERVFMMNKYIRRNESPPPTNKVRLPNIHLRLVYKPHSVQWTPLRGPLVQSSLWARCHHLARCSLPGTGLSHKRERHMRRRAVSHRPQTISSLLGLAPGGGYLATRITACAGGLLHHLFTITPSSHAGVRGCLFLWPLSGRLRLSA